MPQVGRSKVCLPRQQCSTRFAFLSPPPTTLKAASKSVWTDAGKTAMGHPCPGNQQVPGRAPTSKCLAEHRRRRIRDSAIPGRAPTSKCLAEHRRRRIRDSASPGRAPTSKCLAERRRRRIRDSWPSTDEQVPGRAPTSKCLTVSVSLSLSLSPSLSYLGAPPLPRELFWPRGAGWAGCCAASDGGRRSSMYASMDGPSATPLDCMSLRRFSIGVLRWNAFGKGSILCVRMNKAYVIEIVSTPSTTVDFTWAA